MRKENEPQKEVNLSRKPGRPRSCCPEPDQLILLGQEMIKWLKENPEAVHYTEWYSIHKGILKSEWDDMLKKPEFCAYYEQARSILANRHMKGQVKEGIAHRFLRMYLGDLKDIEDQDKIFDSQLKQKEHQVASEEELKKFEILMDKISDKQS